VLDALQNTTRHAAVFEDQEPADNFEMEAMMICRRISTARKKYPVFAFTYSGPHAPQVRNRWGTTASDVASHAGAERLHIWICDTRTVRSGQSAGKRVDGLHEARADGSPRSGGRFQLLKTLNFIDPTRIGMWGWSYGGYTTSYFMTQSKTLKMGIAAGSSPIGRLRFDLHRTPHAHAAEQSGRLPARLGAHSCGESARQTSYHSRHDGQQRSPAKRDSVDLRPAKRRQAFEFMTYPTQQHGVRRSSMQEKHLYSLMTDFVERSL
jgi:dipeptidyl-peptidase-4